MTTHPSYYLTLRSHTQRDPTQDQKHPYPRLALNDFSLNVPFAQDREEERHGVRDRNREGEFCYHPTGETS